MTTSYTVPLYPDTVGQIATQAPAFGVCFSGGGSRAMASALGQISALSALPDPNDHSKKLIGRVSFISSVSGGSWASVPYIYLPDDVKGHRIDDAEFLISTQLPAALYKGKPDNQAPANVCYMAPYCMGVAPGSFTIENICTFLLDFLLEKTLFDLPWSKLWTMAVGHFILEKFGLYQNGLTTKGKTDRFFSVSTTYFNQHIQPKNPALKNSDFYYPRSNRPELIVNYNLLEDISQVPQMPVQATSINTGGRGRTPDGKIVGGGTCESFGFSSKLNNLSDGVATVTITEPYGLNDITGCSSAFFAQWLQDHLGGVLNQVNEEPLAIVQRKGFSQAIAPLLAAEIEKTRTSLEANEILGIVPQYNYWSVAEGSPTPPNQTYGFGDGGAFDNTGILGLLARTSGDIKILSYVNCEQSLQIVMRSDGSTVLNVDSQIPLLFGLQPFDTKEKIYPSFSGMTPDQPLSYVQVFDNATMQFYQLLTQLQANACDGSSDTGQNIAWTRQQLVTVANPVAGITANRKVDLLLVYCDKVQKWQDQITDASLLADIKAAQAKDPDGPLKNFPSYSTFTQVCLDNYQVNMLAQMTGWCTGQLYQQISDMLQST